MAGSKFWNNSVEMIQCSVPDSFFSLPNRQMTLAAVMENPDYFSKKKKKTQIKTKTQLETIQVTALFGRFKDICSLIKVTETVSALLLGTHGKKEYTSSINCVFLIP